MTFDIVNEGHKKKQYFDSIGIFYLYLLTKKTTLVLTTLH